MAERRSLADAARRAVSVVRSSVAAGPRAAEAEPQAVPSATAPAQQAPAQKKAPAKRAPAEKAPAKRAPAKKTAAAKKAPAKKAPAKKAPAKKAPAKKAAATSAPAPSRPETAGQPQTAGTEVAGTAAAGEAAAASGTATPGARLIVREDESPWTASELAEVRAELVGERGRLEIEIATLQSSITDVLRDSGDGAGDDQADTGAKAFEREQEMTLLANAQETLFQTRHALGRMDDRSYGHCESCGNPVGKLRLQAFPRATLCVTCKQRQERR